MRSEDTNIVSQTQFDKDISGRWIEAKNHLFPAWIAETDFVLPSKLQEVLVTDIQCSSIGYARTTEKLEEQVKTWKCQRNGAQNTSFFENTKVLFGNGVLELMSLVLKQKCECSDAVGLFTPVYAEFEKLISANNLISERINLQQEQGRFFLDFENAKRSIINSNVKALIICNPQNPSGQCWTKESLDELISLSQELGIVAIFDEIHSDLVYDRERFYSGVHYLDKKNVVVLDSPTKAFNYAGLKIGYALTTDMSIVKGLQQQRASLGGGYPGKLAIKATNAAYTKYGSEWLDHLLGVIRENFEIVQTGFSNLSSRITVFPPDASFLVWIDCQKLNLSEDKLKEILEQYAGVLVSYGHTFGSEESGCFRLNIGLSKPKVKHVTESICRAIEINMRSDDDVFKTDH